MKKKMITALLASAMVLSLVACGGGGTDSNGGGDTSSSGSGTSSSSDSNKLTVWAWDQIRKNTKQSEKIFRWFFQ